MTCPLFTAAAIHQSNGLELWVALGIVYFVPNPNVNPTVKSLDTIKCDKIQCVWNEKRKDVVRDKNKDMWLNFKEKSQSKDFWKYSQSFTKNK